MTTCKVCKRAACDARVTICPLCSREVFDRYGATSDRYVERYIKYMNGEPEVCGVCGHYRTWHMNRISGAETDAGQLGTRCQADSQLGGAACGCPGFTEEPDPERLKVLTKRFGNVPAPTTCSCGLIYSRYIAAKACEVRGHKPLTSLPIPVEAESVQVRKAKP